MFVLDNLGNLAGLVCLVLLDVLERRIGDHVVTQDPDGGIMKVSPTLQDVWLSQVYFNSMSVHLSDQSKTEESSSKGKWESPLCTNKW